MDAPQKTLAEYVASYPPAEDVDDLDTARRLITRLRADRQRMAEEAEAIAGEFTAFLDDEHMRMLDHLYNTKRLFGDPKDTYWLDPPDVEEAFTDYVESCLDVSWDMAHDEDAGERRRKKNRFPRRMENGKPKPWAGEP